MEAVWWVAVTGLGVAVAGLMASASAMFSISPMPPSVVGPAHEECRVKAVMRVAAQGMMSPVGETVEPVKEPVMLFFAHDDYSFSVFF